MVHACYGLDKNSSSSHMDKLLLEFVEFKLAMNNGTQGVRYENSSNRRKRIPKASRKLEVIEKSTGSNSAKFFFLFYSKIHNNTLYT